MAITINGDGTISGVSVGGLPDGIVDTDMLASNAVTTAKITDGNVTSAKVGTLADSNMPAGSVIQVVLGSTSTMASNTSNSVWVDTNLSASITPSSTSSKILIIGQHGSARVASGSSNGIALQLLRGATVLTQPVYEFLYSTVGIDAAIPFNWLDSPSTTSSVTYSTKFKLLTGATSNAQINPNTVVASILLLEIV